jgi:type IV secretion system protein VirB6
MACPAIITGDSFLLRVLTHIDCQAQVIGSYGYLALGQPGSTAAVLMNSLLTLFIALFGIRLLFGPPPGARDLVFDVLKVGIVLTLAFSWPAFRTVIYDVTLKGPAEIATTIGTASGNVVPTVSFAERLQRVDNAIVRLTEAGVGRNDGALRNPDAPGGNFDGIAIGDDAGFGSGRLMFLAGTIGTIALLRIAAGLLLALAPLVAGLWFFPWTRGLAAGWAKGLVLTIAGSIGASIVVAVELAIIEPWLANALRLRTEGFAIPSAPTELFAIMLAFAIVQLMMIWLLSKVVFTRGWLNLPDWPRQPAPILIGYTSDAGAASRDAAPRPVIMPRVERIGSAIEATIRREQASEGANAGRTALSGMGDSGPATPSLGTSAGTGAARLGSSYRRSGLRTSSATRARDSQR